MNVAPFDLRRCPAIRTAEAAATRDLARVLAALPAAWPIDLRPLGSAVVKVAGVDVPSAASEPMRLAVVRGRSRGQLVVTSAFAARLVDSVLGGRGLFAAARALGPAERGVLVALLAPVLDAFGAAIDLAPLPASFDGASIALRIEGAFGAGTLWLSLPWPEVDLGRPLDPRQAAALAVEARIELADTRLPAGALAGLAPGDAVVFDGVGPAAADRPWEARLAIGDHAAAARLDPDGALSVSGAIQFEASATAGERAIVSSEEKTMDVTGPTEMGAAALAAAPIEVVAELGRLTLRGDEVLGLAPGMVLTVPIDRARAITLRAGGEAWAEGELVDVDGQLGVRVTRLLRG